MKLLPHYLLASLFFITIHLSCTAQIVKLSGAQRKAHKNFRLLAWNEDCVKNVIFSINRSNRFHYTITTHDPDKSITKYFKGTWTKSNDTLYLDYQSSDIPKSFQHFLLLEIQGKYLIQHMENAHNPVYLRIQFEPIGVRGYHPKSPWDN